MKNFKGYRKYFVLLGGFLLHLTIGNLYSSSSMLTRNYTCMYNYRVEKAIDKSMSIWIFSLSVFGLGSSMTLGGMLANKIGSSLTVLIGGWFMSINVLLMCYTMCTYPAIIIISYGLFKGMGSGLVYGVTMGAVLQWFPKRRGLVCGVVVSGFGLAAFVFDLVLWKFNDNYVSSAYLVIGSIYIVIQFISSLLLIDVPKVYETQMSSNIGTQNSNSSHVIEEVDPLEVNIRTHHLYLELDYWVMWITLALLSSCFTLIISIPQEYGSILGLKSQFVFAVSIIGSIFNSFYRILWGYFIDKNEYKTLMLILTTMLSLFFGTFICCSFVSNIVGKQLFYLTWIAILYSLSSGIFTIFPFTCYKLFGLKYFVSNYGLLFTAYSFGGLITGVLESLLSSQVCSKFIAGCTMSLLAALITLLYRGKSLIHSITLFN